MIRFRVLPFVLSCLLLVLAVVLELFAGCTIGTAIMALAVFDFMVILTVGLIAAPLVVTNRVAGRTQGVATFIVSCLVLCIAAAAALAAIALLFTMIAFLYFPPAYFFAFSAFPISDAALFLAGIMVCKISFALTLIAAHPKFLENTGLVVIVATSIGLTVLVTFLHGIVPSVFVRITDTVGAIVILVLAVIRAFGFAAFSLPAIKKATGL